MGRIEAAIVRRRVRVSDTKAALFFGRDQRQCGITTVPHHLCVVIPSRAPICVLVDCRVLHQEGGRVCAVLLGMVLVPLLCEIHRAAVLAAGLFSECQPVAGAPDTQAVGRRVTICTLACSIRPHRNKHKNIGNRRARYMSDVSARE